VNSTIRPALDTLGVLGLPMPIQELASKRWDALIVGAGHNGLACAAYLAEAGKQVLVLEARRRIGGACTFEETWPGYRVSPCAYLLGLLHPKVIDELDLVGEGLSWTLADAGLFVPFEDGASIQLWDDTAKCEEEIRRFAPGDLAGWRAMSDVKRRLRDALRPANEHDLWIGPAPTREQIEARLNGDREAIGMLFEWSMVEYVERYLNDERLQSAYLGQGVIGTNASPHDQGTASIHFHHQSGRLGGEPGAWGYVKGGVGMVSMLLADIARKRGAVIASGVPVARIEPGRGVLLEAGERVNAPVVISNADPRTTMRLLDEDADSSWRARVEAIPMIGCTVKLNVALRELPNFLAKPGTREPHHFGQINTSLSKLEWATSFATMKQGELPARLWSELYFQTAHDPSIAPEGVHTMSVFAQYVPHTFRTGDWDSRRPEVERVALESIGRFCSNIPDAVMNAQVLGPPDIEREVGLSGGHIFQGECLPDQMWSNRLPCRTPMPGVFLCGAGTHPGGSVIGLNGRNAAMEVLRTEPERIKTRTT
jgi:phytoene dehydrogenase-like protein